MIRPPRKIAVVHDFLYCYGGAEKVLEQILHLFPGADLFSLFDFLPAEQRGFLGGRQVQTSFLQHMPLARRKHRSYLPLMPLAIEQLDMSAYDLVISSSYVAAKGVLTGADQLHICYCHTPPRFAWDLQRQYLIEAGLDRGIRSILARLILHYIRGWDARSANNVNAFATNSQLVGRRVAKYYGRDSVCVYPPVDVERFTPGQTRDDFYLTASRLVGYKRVNLIVQAFSRMPDRQLVVIGEGPDFARISALAESNVKMMGYQPFEVLRDHMRRAKAFIFAAEEDFGIVPVEAMACGTPVIALGRGGALETVAAGRSGIFFDEQTPESLITAIGEFERRTNWDQRAIRAVAQRFSVDRFRAEFSAVVNQQWARFDAARPRPAGTDNHTSASEAFPPSRQIDLPIAAAAESPEPSAAELI